MQDFRCVDQFQMAGGKPVTQHLGPQEEGVGMVHPFPVLRLRLWERDSRLEGPPGTWEVQVLWLVQGDITLTPQQGFFGMRSLAWHRKSKQPLLSSTVFSLQSDRYRSSSQDPGPQYLVPVPVL